MLISVERLTAASSKLSSEHAGARLLWGQLLSLIITWLRLRSLSALSAPFSALFTPFPPSALLLQLPLFWFLTYIMTSTVS